jgi:hypothetical protein
MAAATSRRKSAGMLLNIVTALELFKFLFGGRNLAGEDRIYAVNADGQLLSYGDAGTLGNASDPMVVGSGGWMPFNFLFGGTNAEGRDRIYAVPN